MLTVVEAARELNIGRTLAYQLTARYLAGRPGGIPAVRLGGCGRCRNEAAFARLAGSAPIEAPSGQNQTRHPTEIHRALREHWGSPLDPPAVDHPLPPPGRGQGRP